MEPLPDKFRSFGWNVIETEGHDIDQLLTAFDRARSVTGMPTAIIAHTVKGKGVSFMENNVDFHGKAPNPEETRIALKELE
jgi:transketolase